MKATLIFPHQLYAKNPALTSDKAVFLYEDPLYFTQYNFHKKKLLLHRASMKSYQHLLETQSYRVTYLEVGACPTLEQVMKIIREEGFDTLHYVDTTDYLLERRLHRHARNCGLGLKKFESPNFILTPGQFADVMGLKRKYFMAAFYMEQRKRLSILVDADNEPAGGKWSFDTENRKKIPRSISLPPVYAPKENQFLRDGKAYIDLHFSENYGDVESFSYPVDHEQAEKNLDDFLLNRLRSFGDYEDAIVAGQSILFHSVVTPSLNIGLLTPQQVINRTLEFHRDFDVPLNSLEGFIRQIIGWREFMRGLYALEGVHLRTRNFLGFSRSIPRSFWQGETGIAPVDFTIQKVLRHGYCHHIERLMILGNFMHLCGFHPDEVYRWFMELFIDAYDWVMVSNVYGMSQYAGGAVMTTKPYVSGSNYVLKMSDYKRGEWCAVWDSLYWRYLLLHEHHFKRNPRMKMVYNILARMDRNTVSRHIDVAEKFLSNL